mgnify:FL=1
MIYIALIEPEIPQNTGNIARTAVATGSTLILVHPLGFSLDEKYCRRSGLDYWQDVKKIEYPSFSSFIDDVKDKELFFFSSHGKKSLKDIKYPENKDLYFIFGKESVGLDKSIIDSFSNRCFRIPMIKGVRCLNLSNSVAVVVYDALSSFGYKDLD